MPGFAEKQFYLQKGEPLLTFSSQMKFEEYALPIDIRAAFYLSQGHEIKEEILTLFAFLFAASRCGHLCVEISQVVSPSVKSVWPIDEEAESEHLEEKILKGFSLLEHSFFEKNPNLKKIHSKLYLEKNWAYESEIELYYKKIEKDQPELSLTFDFENLLLTDEQQKAIQKSFSHCLSFIAGGPGVGKTYTATLLIKEFIKQYPKAKVAIVAPTGKAVANLQQYLVKMFQKIDSNIESFTLHKLFHHQIYSFLPFDLILVDESSMVDAHFMLLLLKYYKPRSRLIFLGDPNQLPPVGPGFVFSDLINISSFSSKLTECKRTDIKEMLDLADAVKEGNDLQFIKKLESQHSFFNLDQKEDFFEHIEKQFPKVCDASSLYQKLLAFQAYKVLSPVRKGKFGVENINQTLKKMRLTDSYHPIMITANDYRLELFNGDMGLLIDEKEAIFFSRHLGESYIDKVENVRRIPLFLLPSYELAYCISVHKSQGSEYDFVSIVIPQEGEVFSRELLYTAITRAKKGFEIFSTKHTLGLLIKNQNTRLSGFSLSEEK